MPRHSSRYQIGPALRAARRRKGLPPEVPALHVGMSVQSIWAFEAGRRRPSVDVLAALADLYGVSVDSLLRRMDDEVVAS